MKKILDWLKRNFRQGKNKLIGRVKRSPKEKVELKFFTRISFFLKKRGKNILVIITFTTILGVIGVISYKIFFPGHLSQSAEAVFSSPLTFKAFRVEDIFLDQKLKERQLEQLQAIKTYYETLPLYFRKRLKCLEEGRWRYYDPVPKQPKIPPFRRSAAYPGTQAAVADGTVLLFVCLQALVKQT